MKYDETIERLANFYTSDKFALEVQRAKKEFQLKVGSIDEADVNYEERAAQFLDWFIFGREFDGTGRTPLEDAHINKELGIDEETQGEIHNLSHYLHSLFEFLKIKGSDVYIRDLFSKKKIVIQNSEVLVGFNNDELFEARIVPDEKNFYFTKGLCFHPPQVKKYILKEMKVMRKKSDEEKRAFLTNLMKKRYKSEQYKHINPLLIYNETARV